MNSLSSLDLNFIRKLSKSFFRILCILIATESWTFPGRFDSLILSTNIELNPLNPELNPICYLLALLAHHFLHVSRIRVKSLTLRLLMSYIYIYTYIYIYIHGAPILDVSDHTQRRSTVGRTPLDE